MPITRAMNEQFKLLFGKLGEMNEKTAVNFREMREDSSANLEEMERENKKMTANLEK